MPVIWSLAFLLAGCATPADTGEDSAAVTTSLSRLPPGLRERVASGESVVIFAQLKESDLTPSLAHLPRRERRLRRADAYSARMDAVLSRLPARGMRLLGRYRNVPMMPVEVDDVAVLDALEADDHVEMIFEEQHHEVFLTESLDLIDQPIAAAEGFTGEGTAVVIIDTGLDYTREAFGACTAPGEGEGCRVVYMDDLSTRDDTLDSGTFHGTNVAGIIAGVAPGADLIGLDVFAGSRSNTHGILVALDWSIDNVDTYNIAALNLSLGEGSYSSPCTATLYTTALANVRAEGIIPVVAAGNDGWGNKMASPACDPSVLSVGAVYDSDLGDVSWKACRDMSTATDQVACFSNSTSFLDILAPGAAIEAAGITESGTSQAAAHISGAIAVLRAAFPDDTADELQSRLTSTGVPVVDPRQGRVTPRLDLPAALEGADSGGSAPSGTVEINSGSSVTRSPTLSLSLSSATATEMCVSESTSPACSAWESYAPSKSYTLTGTSREVTLYASFRNGSGTSSATSDGILYDISLPSDGSVLATPGAGSLAVSWSGFSDAHSGIASYKLVYLTGSTSPASACTSGTTAYTGTGSSTTLSGLTNGTAHNLRLCAVDVAGNTSTGATVSATPSSGEAPDQEVVINGGDELTNNRKVTLTMSMPGATHMCISNSSRCTSWQAYNTTKAWNLSAGSGDRTVQVSFKVGGTVVGPYTDTIVLDATKPGNPTLTGEGSDGTVDLRWSGATDGHSGVASYKLVYSTGARTTGSSCSSGTVGYVGSEDRITLTGLSNGTTHNLRLCAVDNAGNVSTGTLLTLVPAPEYDAPTGSVYINGSSAWTGSTKVTLTILGEDASEVSAVCISSSTRCTAWQTYTETKTWTLASGTGTKTVYVWLKDTYGNAMSEPVSDSISLDTTRPVDGVVSASTELCWIHLSWSGFSDAHTSVASYKVVLRTGSAKPAKNCTNGTVVYQGTETYFKETGVDFGVIHNYRICAIDEMGNISAGATLSVTP